MKYLVTWSVDVEVEAESKEEAKRITEQNIPSSDFNSYYCSFCGQWDNPGEETE